jgi:hypothetical protein
MFTEKIGTLTKTSTTQVQLTGSSIIKLGGQQRSLVNPTLLISVSGIGGLDTGVIAASSFYYVYAIYNGSTVGIVASLNAISPTGFTRYKKVGAFYTDSGSLVFQAQEIKGGVIQEATSLVKLDTGNDHGSTNTCIRRFVNIRDNFGIDITYVDSATLGATFTINTDGYYSIDYTDSFGVASVPFGVSRNSATLTTSVSLISNPTVLTRATADTAQSYYACSYSGPLLAGDVIRAHTNGAANATSQTRVHFAISKQGTLK